MSFDFDRLTDRSATYSYKWDVCDGELPMWVADMDFETAPEVKAALINRAQHGIFGYSSIPDDFFRAVSEYFGRRHGFAIPVEWMVYSNGVVAAISSVVRRLTSEGDYVLIQAPVYNIFYNSILNNSRRVLSSNLVYRDGEYSIDFEDLEEKLARPDTSLMILCNPHNPVGRIWTAEELRRIGELCKRHNVRVLSDEIHCDIVAPVCEYTPFASVNDTCADISVNAYAASKTFNIAGLQSACIAVKDEELRYKVWRGINTDEVGEPNAFSMTANIAAFSKCDSWVDALREYLFENRRIAEKYIVENIPILHPVRANATYLMWIDVSKLCEDSVRLCEMIRESTGLYLSDGAEYGECGRGFVRMNLATQRARLMDGLERLRTAVNKLVKDK